MKLDHIDRNIISILQTDGRITNTALASQCGISPPAMLERVKRLETAGIILGYSAIINPKKIGIGLIALVSVSVAVHRLQNIQSVKEQFKSIDEVIECYYVSGEDDFILKVAVRDMDEYTNMIVTKLSIVEGIEKIKTSFILSSVKYETKLPVLLADQEG